MSTSSLLRIGRSGPERHSKAISDISAIEGLAAYLGREDILAAKRGLPAPSSALKLIGLAYAGMHDGCMKREQNQAGIEALARFKRGLDSPLGFHRRHPTNSRRKHLVPERAMQGKIGQ